jgi:hypothetical protein
MAETTDGELYEILHLNRAEYSEEAIAVAEKELARRNLEPATLDEFRADVERKKEVATTGLSLPVKLFFVLCGLTCFGVIFAVVVEVVYREADTKYREVWRWTGYGFAASLVIGALALLAFLAGSLGLLD